MEKAFDIYINSYLKICPQLKKEELNFIRSNLSISEYKKGQFYLENGKVQRQMGFVYSGLLRSYYVNEQGKKVTIGFINEGKYASDYPSFLKQKPSKYYIETIEPAIIVHLPYLKIQEAYRIYKNFEQYGRFIAEEILIQKQDKLESFLFMNAEERYLHFIERNEDIANRVSISHLSSYLGIERQSLSRIRKKIAGR